MSFLKYIFFIIALVAVLEAQEMEDMDLEALEELPSIDSASDEPISDQQSNQSDEEFTESYLEVTNSEDSQHLVSTASYTNVETTESIADTTHPNKVESDSITETPTPNEGTTEEQTEPIAVIFEEMEERLMGSQQESSTQPSVIQSATDAEVMTTVNSEYNGLDSNKSETTFSCYGRAFGQYADIQKECRVFHLCYPYFNSTTDELLYQRISFLCDNDSVFDQKRFICVNNSTVEHKCSDSQSLYLQTNQEYLIRVFSQSVSPIDEMKGQENHGSNRNWMSWLYPQ